jgi:hypothetical protein
MLVCLETAGAWQTGVPVTGNAAASDQKKSTNVTIDDEKLTIDVHQEPRPRLELTPVWILLR